MADTPDEIAELIDTVAAGPASATVDGRSAVAHRISELIELEKHRANQSLSGTGSKPAVRFFKTKPPGAS